MEEELTLDLSKTYIYEGLEYVLTGRVAEKELNTPPPTTRRRRSRRQEPQQPETKTMVVRYFS